MARNKRKKRSRKPRRKHDVGEDDLRWAQRRARELSVPEMEITSAVNLPNLGKMSEVIEKFAAPLLEAAETEEDQSTALTIAALAWNFALTPKKLRRELLKDSIDQFSGADLMAGLEFRRIMTDLIRRKEEFFPDVDRFILDCKIHSTPTGMHLAVLSSMPEPPPEKE